MSQSLHELLAVESNLKGQSDKCRAQLADTFDKKRHLFGSKVVVFQPLAEGQPAETTVESDVQTTVGSELKWLSGHLAKAIDVSFQVAEANTAARADIILEDGNTLATGVPATALLELEKRISEIKAIVEAVPTLDPAKGFTPDANFRLPGVFRARDVQKTRTAKIKEVLTLAPSTDKHPAQCQVYDKDVPTGKVLEQEWSGLITPAAKADLINRVEIVARGVRKARSRANNVTIDSTRTVGAALFDYILG
jgi:hypothetical protein